ncbi:MAG: homoserine kinase [Hyphomicrobiales bacterium]|nr:homoserine kinase [Hyphomicrobiales bacterium]
MAVYTHVSAEALHEFLKAYDMDEVLAFKGIAEGVENSNYFLQTNKGRFILTLYEKRVAEKDVPFFLALTAHLCARGFPCPKPIADKSGRVQSVLEGRPAALIQFLEGVSIHKASPEHCAQVGNVLARLHLASQGFSLTRANTQGMSTWRGLLQVCEKKIDTYPHDVRDELHAAMDGIEQNWREDLPGGIIHADLFPDNILFRGGELKGVIDFYFACNDSLAYDIAICMNAWCFTPEWNFAPDNARALLGGYQQARALQKDEIDALPLLCRGAAIRFALTRLHDLIYHVDGSLVTPKDPMEYLVKLRFHDGIKDIKGYGLEP